MNANWYPQQQQENRRPQYQAPGPSVSNGTVDAVHDAHRLLAVYPFASATPTNHVARHLSGLSLTATPPSYYVQPTNYNAHISNPQQYHSQYLDYAREINHLASPSVPYNDGGYWQSQRNEAVKYLGQQSSYAYQDAPQWSNQRSQHSGPSSYQPSAFAQSVFQRTAPTAAYPTPPPPGIRSSSSSLAMALGAPVPMQPQQPAQPPKTYTPAESPAFFDNFLAQQTAGMRSTLPEMKAQRFDGVELTPRKKQLHADFVPPHAMPQTPDTSSRKRKAGQALESPSLKRTVLLSNGSPMKQEDNAVTNGYSSSMAITPSIVIAPSMTVVETSSPTPTPRQKLQAYVELPPMRREFQTPSQKGKERMQEEDEFSGFPSEGDGSPRKRFAGSVMSPTKRATGDRDDRGPLEKFLGFVEDVFEAEDSLPPDIDPSDLPPEFFSPLTSDPSQAMLHRLVVNKLTKLIIKGSGGHTRQATRDAVNGSPRKVKRSFATVDTTVLSRLLRILERSVRAGEDLDPFKTASNEHARVPAKVELSPRKPPRKKKGDNRARSKSATPHVNGEDEGTETANSALQEVMEVDLEALSRALELARDSLAATDCCLALLSSDRLQKQLYSEELITMCLSTVKNQLTKIIYPFVEASSDSATQLTPLLLHVIQSPADSDERHLTSEIFHSISSVIPRINDLISADSMSMPEAIVIQAVYVAIGPFFVVEGGTDGKGKEKKSSAMLDTLGTSAMRGLRLDALALIRSIFANYEDQRGWIIEEILSSLIKLSDTKQKAGQFRLRDGRSIRTVSALLMQLVQTSAHDVRVEVDSLRRARQQDLVMGGHSTMKAQNKETFLDEKDMEELRLYASGLDSATKAAKTIIAFLTHRSGKTKSTKNANEAEYRIIFDNLIADLLTVLFWPEWPAAAVVLGVAVRFMVSSLDDIKTSTQSENNAAKTMALDHLGVIAARLRPNSMRTSRSNAHLTSVDENFSKRDHKGLKALMGAHRDISLYLCRRSSEDQACQSARELSIVVLGQELAIILKQCARLLEDPNEDDGSDIQDELVSYGKKMKEMLHTIWDDQTVDVFDSGTSQEEIQRIDQLAEEIGMTQGLKSYFNPILNTVIQSLDAQPVFMRTKALKALGQIITSDPEILSAKTVRHSIDAHLLDSSSAVRDAAVELIGKYIIESPQLADKYYKQVADRIQDTGLGVRKRVLKLFKTLYGATNDRMRRIDMCNRIVQRMGDEDDTVKDLAMKTLEELWFTDTPSPSVSGTKATPPVDGDKSHLLVKVSIIMGTAACFKDRNSPLEDLLHTLITQKDGTDASLLHRRYSEICEVLIDGLVDASDLPGFTVVSCVRTICLFTSANPSVLTASHASTLLPYLKNSSTPEDQATSDYLLRIYRAAIPHLPKTALKFGQDLQTALQPMIIKPSPTAGIAGLQETVACLCSVVQHISHEYRRLVALLKSCSARLMQTAAKPATVHISPQDMRALPILVLIVALLCEYCNFDDLRSHADLQKDLNAISQGPITEYMYTLFLKLYNRFTDVSLRSRLLQCLGFLFRAQPSLLTAEPSSQIMDAIFASDDEDARSRLLKIMQDFLVAEADKHTAKEKDNASKSKKNQDTVNMDELVGNTDGFAESGVSSAIVQRYLQPILAAALSQNGQMQAPAVDILAFTIKQGLAHPLQCFPVIVALETSPNLNLSAHACHLHSILHTKHTSLLNTRYVASARSSFDYQKKCVGTAVQGYRMTPAPTALLHRWYTLVREKRPLRQDFLKSLTKVFDIEITKTSQDDVEFARYMAENFASFDYRTQEEVLTVLKYQTSVLSTTGMQLVEAVCPSHLLKQLHDESAMQGQEPPPEVGFEIIPEEEFQRQLPMIRSSIIICIIMLLKTYLKALYGISEEKSSKWVLGKKSAIGDRPAVRRHERPLTWDNVGAVFTPILTSEELVSQRRKFLEVWSEDGVNAEPEDDFNES
ncbi:hypothetical protein BDY19DRAFT_165528 [Irpex rosettiformis]|uniref:Uncharacterized protein n=1 Tax=Irpex rosettiformis TaxID=378272 RepID=A0ACB8U2K8_9APHY|nr:hypothetical protein BDY19DRAFT_165528 [Irpex rosettiformis]